MRYVLGFDGGGTKTECVLMDADQHVLAISRSGPSNPLRVGLEQGIAAINEAAQAAMLEGKIAPQAIAGLCAGIAGTGNPERARQMRGALAASFPGTVIKVLTDLEIALAAMDDGPAVLLIAGTGSAAIGRGLSGRIARSGGSGPRIGDEGSAGDIGKQAVLAARGKRVGGQTTLGKLLLLQIGAANWNQAQTYLDTSGDEIYPRLFPLVANAADAGEEISRQLLRTAAVQLAALVKTLTDQLALREVSFPLAKMGGMIGRCTFFDNEIDMRLREAVPKARITALEISPAHAAARIALTLISRPVPEELHG
jgi:N-acetylmuramic acid 6-phosphate etherase